MKKTHEKGGIANVSLVHPVSGSFFDLFDLPGGPMTNSATAL